MIHMLEMRKEEKDSTIIQGHIMNQKKKLIQYAEECKIFEFLCSLSPDMKTDFQKYLITNKLRPAFF